MGLRHSVANKVLYRRFAQKAPKGTRINQKVHDFFFPRTCVANRALYTRRVGKLWVCRLLTDLHLESHRVGCSALKVSPQRNAHVHYNITAYHVRFMERWGAGVEYHCQEI